MNLALIDELTHFHRRAHDLVARLSEADLYRQLHGDLSPAAWHLGHMAIVESYWIREEVMGETLPAEWKVLYFPERTPRAARAQGLPGKEALLQFVDDLHTRNRALLADLVQRGPRHRLVEDDYLVHFLLQHHAQHLEILQQICLQSMLKASADYAVHVPLLPVEVRMPDCTLSDGIAVIGHEGEDSVYDNELKAHEVRIASYALRSHAVSNAEFLGFVECGGYDRVEFWTRHGWAWRAAAAVRAPLHWRNDLRGQWYAVEPEGPRDLSPERSVEGISYHEACAFARYAGCRLPDEQEWECAAKADVIPVSETRVWEWCNNAFFPYPGFRAFPYDGYSLPWFDGRHYTLRGGSRYTDARVRRATFRNFYTPDKRHIFAGLRLAL